MSYLDYEHDAVAVEVAAGIESQSDLKEDIYSFCLAYQERYLNFPMIREISSAMRVIDGYGRSNSQIKLYLTKLALDGRVVKFKEKGQAAQYYVTILKARMDETSSE